MIPAGASAQAPRIWSGDGAVAGTEIPQRHEQSRADRHVFFVTDISSSKDLKKAFVDAHRRFLIDTAIPLTGTAGTKTSCSESSILVRNLAPRMTQDRLA